MITKELVDRINRLAQKQRATGLTEEEKEEQHKLRQEYLQGIRSQVVYAMDSMGVKPKDHHTKCACESCKDDKKIH
ncbi:MAG: DUF896 domain-containing protein [Desulfocucumaceae bacterium]